MVEAVSGEGRTGLAGLVSLLNDRRRDTESGMGAPFPLKGEFPPLLRLILLKVSCIKCAVHGCTRRPMGPMRPKLGRRRGRIRDSKATTSFNM
jgi:hypothetical protein